MLKLTKLLLNGDDSDSFRVQIEPTDEQGDFLIACKDKIRNHLRPRIAAATIQALGMEHRIEPRFRTQGSWSYDTCVQAAHQPPQEMDWDYGVYLPVSALQENFEPQVAARAYFVLVENLLEELCRKEGWILQEGRETCIRIQVAKWAHIDIPLYAAPESEFVRIQERVRIAKAAATYHFTELRESVEAGELPDLQWEQMDGIYVALRSGSWKKSDPESVSRWFRDCLAEHNDQLRRICRYIKAWRDYHWRDGGTVSSVALMIAVGQEFEILERRDDLALEYTARRFAKAILNPIREPTIGDGAEDFTASLTSEMRRTISKKALQLADAFARGRSLPIHQAGDAVALIRDQLGPRIKGTAAWIENDGGADAVRATPAAIVAAPWVGSTQAG